MKVAKVRKVKTPTRGTKKSAGIDFYIPEDFRVTVLRKTEAVLIPSGIKVKIPTGYMLLGLNKSGVTTKLGLQIGAQVIDEDYQGEIHIHLTKIAGAEITLEPGMKIAQFVLIPVAYDEIEEFDAEYLYSEVSERGECGFGSTGIK